MPSSFQNVFLESAGYFMPGSAVSNDEMDAYIAPLDRMSQRIKRRVLGENGIRKRHYGIDAEGRALYSNAQLAAHAVRNCITRSELPLADLTLLASGSSGGDTLMPGFANMIQGELAAPPLEALSLHGVCAAGIAAVQAAAMGVELGTHSHAVAVASEMPSRLFKASRFAARGYHIDFDSHFLRWMLSDGAGAWQLGSAGGGLAKSPNVRLKLKWIHQRSFSGDYPVCMQLGLTEDRARGHLEFASWAEAEAAGALALRQDIRLLPHLFDVGIHEYAALVNGGWVEPARVNHFLCHYSSEKFAPLVDDLMTKAGLAIPRERWWSNLAWRGNTGAASMLVMLAEFLETHALEPGAQVFCYVPESGRFTTAFLLFEAEAVEGGARAHFVSARGPSGLLSTSPFAAPRVAEALEEPAPFIAAPQDANAAPAPLQPLLTELATIWHDYRSRVWRTPLLRQIREQRFTVPDYRNWMAQWVPQVREGSLWMREGAASLSDMFRPLAALISTHADDEQHDFKLLFDDYRHAGGEVAELDRLTRNPGGEALNAFLHALAATRDPFGLLGAIYVIEGTGQRIVPTLLPLLKAQLGLGPEAFRFLEYHGQNDAHHLARWLQAVELVLALDASGDAARQIADTARQTAQLYLMQFQHVTEVR